MSTFAKAALTVVLLTSLIWLIHFGPAAAGSRNPAEHSQTDCAQCHSLIAQTDNSDPTTVNLSSRCRDCHGTLTEIDNQPATTFHKNPDRPCTDCHFFHDTEMLTVAGTIFRFDFEGNSAAFQCYACHTDGMSLGNLSPGHQLAKKLYHTDSRLMTTLSPSETCMACHTSGSAVAAVEMNGLTPPRFSQHATHPLGVTVLPGSGNVTNQIRQQLDTRLPLHDGRVECQSCHSLTSKTAKNLINFDNTYDLCLGCHQHNQ